VSRSRDEILVRGPDESYPIGWTTVTRFDESVANTGIGFDIWRCKAGEREVHEADKETAYLLMEGRVSIRVGDIDQSVVRKHLFDDGPSCLHVAAGTEIVFDVHDETEFAVFRCPNTADFTPEWVLPDDRPVELRGKGTGDDACLRMVRTLLLPSSLRDEADGRMELDLGEVLTLPGRWSSYPPHRHRQRELYHYRFTDTRGYGHAEQGDDVFRVQVNDTVKILDGVFHSQVTAPGYGMYYFYLSRDARNQPFDTPTFAPDHAWLRDKDATFWLPAGFGRGTSEIDSVEGEHDWSGERAEFWSPPAPRRSR